MIRTIKENYYLAVKMLLDQVVMCVFGAMMSFAGAASKSDTILALLSAFSVIFYLYLIYAMFYDVGQKDGIKINSNRLVYDKLKPLYIAIVANSLNFLLGLLAVIFKAFIRDLNGNNVLLTNLHSFTEDMLTPGWAISAYNICHELANVIQIMYSGLLKVLFSGNVFMLIVIPIPAVLIAVIGYNLGVRFCDGIKSKNKSKSRYKD